MFASAVFSTLPYPCLSVRKLFYPYLRRPDQGLRILLHRMPHSEIFGSGGTSNCQ